MPIIQAVDRAIRILELFDEQNAELKVTEISERLNLHKSTVHSLLKTLQMHGYVRQNEENGKYRIGLKLLERGQLVAQTLDIRSIARPFIVRLSQETGQTVHLVLMVDGGGVYIDKVEGERAVIRYSRIGKRVPFHSSAAGKVLIAFLSDAELNRLLQNYEFERRTERTITDKAALLEELKRVRERGYAIDDQENEIGVRCYAVPLRNHTGEVIAAVSISMLASLVSDEEISDYIQKLHEVSVSISQRLGYSHLSTAERRR